MRHLNQGNKLSRDTQHLLATLRSISRNMIIHQRIVTTPAKAKEARRFLERLVTFAIRGDLSARRLAIARLADRDAVNKLFAEIAPRFVGRKGGYTRIIHLTKRRLGDNAPQVLFEFVGAPREESKTLTEAEGTKQKPSQGGSETPKGERKSGKRKAAARS